MHLELIQLGGLSYRIVRQNETLNGPPPALRPLISTYQEFIVSLDEIVKNKYAPNDEDENLLKEMHRTIHDVTQAIESFGFNVAIARLYGLQTS